MLPSILRTFVPLIVGFVLNITFFSGIDSVALTGLITSVLSAAYWVVVRFLEQYETKFGWLLGYAAQPRYAPPAIEETVQKNDNLDLEVKVVSA